VWAPYQIGFRPFREYWFSLAISDPAAMHLVLSNAALHRMLLRPTEEDTIISLKHSRAAIQSIIDRVLDPVRGTTDEMFGAVLGVCCTSI
jgi:hypothetical protein